MIYQNETINKETVTPSLEPSENQMAGGRKKISNSKDNKPSEAIDAYFRLKEQYRTDHYDFYVKPIVLRFNKDSNKRKAKQAFKYLEKPRCINCRRAVGTIFSQKIQEDVRYYIAKCGDVAKPCPLDIRIRTPTVVNIVTEMKEQLKAIEEIKTAIIRTKNDLLFGYVAERDAFALFEKNADDLKENTENYEFFLKDYIERNENMERQSELRSHQTQLGIFVNEYKSMINKYNSEKAEKVIQEAVSFYLSSIVPKMEEILDLKYQYNAVEYGDNGVYYLIQKPNIVSNAEISLSLEKAKVEAFVFGTSRYSKSMTKRNRRSPPSLSHTQKAKTYSDS